jgi:transcriptional regulator with XRE-family HTH domain
MIEEIKHTNQKFREFIRERRKELGLTQAELAKRARIGQPYVSKIESGVIRLPSTFTIESLAKALEMDIEELEWETLPIPDDGKVGYCRNLRCPGSNFAENSHVIIRDNRIDYSQWQPYKTLLEDDEGRIEFCAHCGNKLLTECQNCGRKLKQFYRYCPGCGYHLLNADGVEDDDTPF